MREYSFIKPDYSLQNNLMAFGWECEQGWWALIEELCNKIQDVIDSDPENEVYKNFEFQQVKEKFGEIRIYTIYGDEKTEALIDEYSILINKTCEKCGKPGKLTSKDHWMKTLCDDCYKKW